MNYIRACFCIDQYFDLVHLGKLCESLETRMCRTVAPPRLLDSVHWYEQPLVWNLPDVNFAARLIQISHDLAPSMISLDVDESFLLPGAKISYDPQGDPYFAAYTQLIIDLIKQIKPYIGIIDYDADLLCVDLSSNSFRAWGNYLSSQFLSTWKLQEIKSIERLVDEYHSIEQIGILTFNHPLGVGETKEDEMRFWEMIKSRFPSNRE